jgi:uncharacterized protein (DUF1778 family)
MTITKDARLNFRLTRHDDELVRDAASALGQSVTEFVTESVVQRAHSVLADRRVFELSDVQWDRFVLALDRPSKPNPRLLKLLSLPSETED